MMYYCLTGEINRNRDKKFIRTRVKKDWSVLGRRTAAHRLSIEWDFFYNKRLNDRCFSENFLKIFRKDIF